MTWLPRFRINGPRKWLLVGVLAVVVLAASGGVVASLRGADEGPAGGKPAGEAGPESSAGTETQQLWPPPSADVATATAAYLATDGRQVVRFAELTDELTRIEPGSVSAEAGCIRIQQALNAEVDPVTLLERTSAIPDEILARLWLDDQAARIAALDHCFDRDWAAMGDELGEIERLGPLVAHRRTELTTVQDAR